MNTEGESAVLVVYVGGLHCGEVESMLWPTPTIRLLNDSVYKTTGGFDKLGRRIYQFCPPTPA